MLKNQQYYDALDGLRTICIIFTVIDHTAGNPGINGTVGVDVFFALSGYLITTLLLRERDKTGQVCLPCFYIRRFFRIVPLYLLAIMLYFPGVWLSYKLTGNTKGLADFNSALPWLSTLNSEWRPDNGNNLFGHAWTLGVEEKFYILWPFLFPLIAVRKRGLLLLAAMPLLACGGPSMTRGYIGILFGVIAALAIQQDDRGVAFIRKVPTSLWAGLMVVGYFVATETGNLYLNLLISLPAALFIAALINREKDFYQMVLSFPILVWLGKLTYVIYLIHRLVGNTFEQLLTTTSRLCDVVCYGLRCVHSCSVVSTRHCRATADKIWPRDGWQAPQYPKQRGHRACLVSGIVHVRKTRCRWRDCPAVYGPSTTLLSSGQYWAPIGGKVRRSIDSLQA